MKNKMLYKLLSQARLHPVISGFLVFILILMSGLGIGWYTPGGRDLTSVVDRAGIYAGWFSISVAWAVGLLLWVQKREAAINFRHAGSTVGEVRKAFDASLILASKHGQPEWHLRHIEPKQVEFLWSSFTAEETERLLEKFPSVHSSCGPAGRDPLRVENVYDMKEIYQAASKMLQVLIARGFSPDRICVDVTSGTGVMTIAAFQAAEDAGVTSIYQVGVVSKSGEPGNLIINEKNLHDENAARVLLLSDHRKVESGL